MDLRLPTVDLFFKVKVMKFKRERNMPDCYTVIDNNFQMDVEGEVGYRYVSA